MTKVEMKFNGKVIGSAEHEDRDVIWDLIEDGAFEFETTY